MLHTPLNRLPHLLRLRTRDSFLDIPILEHTKRRHLRDAQLLRNILAFFNVVRVEFDLSNTHTQYISYPSTLTREREQQYIYMESERRGMALHLDTPKPSWPPQAQSPYSSDTTSLCPGGW
jgi:hypothetical protein